MIAHRGRNRSSFIAGASVHNNRIERLWRDMRTHTIQAYMDLFKSFEQSGMDLTNLLHIFTLQYLFLPRIQECLQQFTHDWNNHKLRTENNLSPLQLMHQRAEDKAFEVDIDPEWYGIEYDQINHHPDEDEQDNVVHLVPCDPIECPLSDEGLLEFQQRVQPIGLEAPFEDLRNLYLEALLIINDIAYRN